MAEEKQNAADVAQSLFAEWRHDAEQAKARDEKGEQAVVCQVETKLDPAPEIER